MHTKIVQIGTSKGVRLPKYLLEKYHLTDDVNIEDTEEGILITPSDHEARSGWKANFKKAAKENTDISIELPKSDWDNTEWEW
jgi:antitoxin MazE